MDKDDILKMAQEAGFHLDNINLEFKKYEYFTRLIAETERTKINASIKQIHDWYSYAKDQE